MAKELLGGLELNRIYQRDCLSDGGMAMIPDKSIDMILCDLPYGTTARNKWDQIIPFDNLWKQYNRVIKDNGAIVLTGKQPFTSMLIMSNPKMFKYSMIWRKNLKTGHLNARRMPMGAYEDVMVFYKKQPTYNPQMIPRTFQVKCGKKMGKRYDKHTSNYGEQKNEYTYSQSDWLTVDDVIDYEDSVNFSADWELENETLYIECVHNSSGKLHPTQKPVYLFEWLIKTYTNEGDIVLDNCMGSGTTAVSALNTNRKFIGFETEPAYIEIANKRIDDLR
jgi:site-specific DNA-methyltransferase (adenine-specific)